MTIIDYDELVKMSDTLIKRLNYYRIYTKKITLKIVDESGQDLYNETPQNCWDIVLCDFAELFKLSKEPNKYNDKLRDLILTDVKITNISDDEKVKLSHILEKSLINTCENLNIAIDDTKYQAGFNIDLKNLKIYTNNGKLFTEETLRKKINELIDSIKMTRELIIEFKNGQIAREKEITFISNLLKKLENYHKEIKKRCKM